MDPCAALADMRDCFARGDYSEAAEYARNIKRWICNGGFVPAGESVRSLRAECNRMIDFAD